MKCLQCFTHVCLPDVNVYKNCGHKNVKRNLHHLWSTGFHDGWLSPCFLAHAFSFHLRTDVGNIGHLCARAADPCLGGVLCRCWRLLGFFSPHGDDDESPSKHMVWLAATVPLCWTVRFFFFFFWNPFGICLPADENNSQVIRPEKTHWPCVFRPFD